MPTYIWQRDEWPNLTYDAKRLLKPLTEATQQHGRLIGRLEGLGFGDIRETNLEAISAEVIQSSEIEGETLDHESVRSSIARWLGMDAGAPSGDHRVEGVVEMALDASQNWERHLTKDRLLNWHAGLFPGGRGPLGPVKTGEWRDDHDGPMQVVSGRIDRPTVHYEAPPAERVDSEMTAFLDWFESDSEPNLLLKAGLAHLRFVTIHPFDDGNGRVGRAVLDLALAQYDRRRWRCYSVSAQIREERKGYYTALEKTQKGSVDVTPWLDWYLECLGRALGNSAENVSGAIRRSRFWQEHADKNLNDRQRKVLRKMLISWEGNLTNKKWQNITHATAQTAFRDLAELVKMRILERDEAGGRGAGYRLILDTQEDTGMPPKRY